MQEENFELEKSRIATLPIVDRVAIELGLDEILAPFIKHERYLTAIKLLIKNILLSRSALYRVGQWADGFAPELVGGRGFNDDVLARALDRLFDADRASLQTKCVLTAIERFGIDTSVIHNDSTSVAFSGSYVHQESRPVQLKRGHSKDHRPDLKQIIYNLSVAGDGAVPVHFKIYDGNRTDDTTHWETWLTLRGLLGRSDFLYVGDSKLCVEETMQNIDRNQGRFVTCVPRTRAEIKAFAEALFRSEVRWESLWRKRSSRKFSITETYEVASGFWQLREGYNLYWYRSSEKMKRDEEEREERIDDAVEKLMTLSVPGKRGPRTAKSFRKKADEILKKTMTDTFIIVDITTKEEEKFKQVTRGRGGPEAFYRRSIKKRPHLTWRLDEKAIAQAKAMDGIFPLTTNTKLSALETLQHYKYQPRLEKRFAFLKSVINIAPVFLKKNRRIEALTFVYFLAMLIAALIESKIRRAMKEAKLKSIPTLPEERPTETPTWEQIERLFELQTKYALVDGERTIKRFHDPLTETQLQVLNLLGVKKAAYQ